MQDITAFPETHQALEERIKLTMLCDRAELLKLWRIASSRKNKNLPADQLEQKWLKLFTRSSGLLAEKLDRRPTVEYPEALPISAKREEIAEAIKAHQVIILAGETGSGKTTQIPKICLDLGLGFFGKIGHTQPRRIAASTVASRIAEELKQPLGEAVGYQVRFSDNTSPYSYIKLMTDGILLAEIQSDPELLQYDTIIIDEAHERSLNIDFLLGYLKQLLPKRPDLKLIVTSATIDLDRFSKHFDNAPIIEVSGRTYPVEILYRPPVADAEDLSQSILDAVEEILTMPRSNTNDILVFLSGEREIRDVAKALRKANLPHIEVLPLYARLSLAEQNKVFQGHKGRRIVLATNVAETSITVPGIGYVIDPGTARISRYSARTKVQRLPIEAISQASANQRAGRCGRVSNGVCIRLYEEEDFLNRPQFTDAEILRTNLASVILQMLNMGFGNIAKFPFVDAPDSRFIRDGFKLLEELRAVDAKGVLTPLGRQLSKIPIDPRLARMVVEGQKQGALKELLIIVAALTIQDPRERPAEKQQASDEKHRRFWNDKSDFLAYVNLWNYAEEQRQALSQNQWRKQCVKEFLSFSRLREWRELHHQIRIAIKALNFKENREPASYEGIHKALLSGLLGNIGLKSDESKEWDYLGTRNRKFSIFPASSQFKKKPRWLMTAELLETSKLYAHCVASIDPEWLLQVGEHLLKHHYYQPHYNPKSGQVMGYDRITLSGLLVAEKKRVNYSHIDEKVAREVFIRSALVEGAYEKNPKKKVRSFYKENQKRIDEVIKLEAKSRRKDIMVDDEILYEFYDQRLPTNIVNLAGFEHWRKEAEKGEKNLLVVPKHLLMQRNAEEITEAQFPDSLEVAGMELPLTYHFEPGHPDDGVSIGIPATALHIIPEHRLDWLVPGLIKDKCISLVKSLPKNLRKKFVPVPHYVDQILNRVSPSHRALKEVLIEQLQHISGETLPEDCLTDAEVDDFYQMNIHVLDERRRVIGRGRKLKVLREKYKDHLQEALQTVGENIEREDIQSWDFGSLDESRSLKRSGVNVKAFPALVLEKESLALRMLDNPVDAHFNSEKGMAYLLSKRFAQQVKYLKQNLIKNKDIGLSVVNMGNRQQVVQDIILAAIKEACITGQVLPRTESQFEQRANAFGDKIVPYASEYEATLLEALNTVVQIRKNIKTNKNALALTFAFSDIQNQLQQLFYEGMLFYTPLEWFKQFPRYLKAITVRLEKAPMNVHKDRLAMNSVSELWDLHAQRLAKEGEAAYNNSEGWREFRWMLEELRVSLFAQTLKTKMPVSEKRLKKHWDELLKTGDGDEIRH